MVIGLTLLFIWGHSLIPADLSSQESGSFVSLINEYLGSAGIGFSVTDHVVRKTAHFLEYAVLGAEIAVLHGRDKKTGSVFPGILFFWIGAPVIDEGIQYFTPGRACMLQDIFLDMCGFCAGYIFFRIMLRVCGNRENAGGS